MATCPVCQTPRIVVVIGSTRRAFCTRCGARWIQEGAVQRAVERFEASVRRLRPVPPPTS
jgi:Zn-finger nucleic acid-binding protein